MGLFSKTPAGTPAPSEAVHIAPNGRKSLCNQSMRGESESPEGTQATCPVCVNRAEQRCSHRGRR